ncbi:MAG: hypothetical protein ACLQAT_14785 [Candidatus Binataceae bacterium]
MKISGKDQAIEHLVRWATRGRWKDEWRKTLEAYFDPICAQLEMTPDELADELGEFHYQTITACAFEDFCSRPKEMGRNVIDDYLEHRGWRESIQGRDYLRALRESVLSLYEVAQVKRGHGIVLRDLIRGGDLIEVDEQLGSENVVQWDRIAVRVLTIDGLHLLSGPVLDCPPPMAERVLGIFRQAPEQARRLLFEMKSAPVDEAALDEVLNATNIALEGGACAIGTIWIASTLEAMHKPLPALMNCDGEPLLFCKTRFPIAKGKRAEVKRRLDATLDFLREPGKDRWSWIRHEDLLSSGKDGRGIEISSMDESGNLILGTLELRHQSLMVEVNSEARADRCRAHLGELFGELIGIPLTETQTVESAMEESRERAPSGKVEEPDIPREDVERIYHQVSDRHYRKVIEEPVPMIGNVSPREAARTPEGREKVVEWLKLLENNEAKRARDSAIPAYDATWIWRELGLQEYRR